MLRRTDVSLPFHSHPPLDVELYLLHLCFVWGVVGASLSPAAPALILLRETVTWKLMAARFLSGVSVDEACVVFPSNSFCCDGR